MPLFTLKTWKIPSKSKKVLFYNWFDNSAINLLKNVKNSNKVGFGVGVGVEVYNKRKVIIKTGIWWQK